MLANLLTPPTCHRRDIYADVLKCRLKDGLNIDLAMWTKDRILCELRVIAVTIVCVAMIPSTCSVAVAQRV